MLRADLKRKFAATKKAKKARRARRLTGRPGFRQVATTHGVAALMRGVEQKFKDYTIAAGAFAVAGTGTFLLCNGLDRGDAVNMRIGRQATMKSLWIRLTVQLPATTTLGGAWRVMFVRDKQANGVAPTAVQILTTDVCNGQYNLEYRKRFQVLFDRYGLISSGVGPANVFHISKYIPLKFQTEYTAAADTTIAGIITNSIYLVTWVDGVATTAPAASGTVRLRYTDL